MSEAKQYEISALADFLAVPEDRLAACLDDFACWLAIHRRVVGHEAELNDLLGGKVKILTGFTWVDDGKPGISGINVQFDFKPS